MTVTTDAAPGLRERKRLDTRNAIQRALLTLAIERGYDAVTIEEISNIAGISPRTFFNYFPTKEAAAIGDVPALPEGEVVEEFVRAGRNVPILDGVRDLLVSTVDGPPNPEGAALRALRQELMRIDPHLLTLRMVSMKQLELNMAEVVARRLEADDPLLDAEALHSRARLITFVAFAAIRHAFACWAEHDGSGPLSKRLFESFAELARLGRSSADWMAPTVAHV